MKAERIEELCSKIGQGRKDAPGYYSYDAWREEMRREAVALGRTITGDESKCQLALKALSPGERSPIIRVMSKDVDAGKWVEDHGGDGGGGSGGDGEKPGQCQPGPSILQPEQQELQIGGSPVARRA